MGIMDENENILPSDNPSISDYSYNTKIRLSVLFNAGTTLELGALLHTAWTYGSQEIAEEAEYYEAIADDDCEPPKRRKTQTDGGEIIDSHVE